MASMSAPSVPGRMGTYTSECMAEAVNCGSMVMSLAPFSRASHTNCQSCTYASAGLPPQAMMVFAFTMSVASLPLTPSSVDCS